MNTRVRHSVDDVGPAPREVIYRFRLLTSEDVERRAKILFLDPSIDG